MSITAIVEKGLIKLPKTVQWASGTVVRIEPVNETAQKSAKSKKRKAWPVAPPKVSKKESALIMQRIEEAFGKVELESWK